MTVCEIINQFTHTNFTLIVLDASTDYEYYNGLAEDVCEDPVGIFQVVAMEPPERAGEVILYVDVDGYVDYDASEYLEEDEQFR